MSERPKDAPAKCSVLRMEANVDRKYLTATDYARAERTCQRKPCVCREKNL